MNSKYIIDPNGRYDSVVGSVIRYGIGLPLLGVLLWVALSMCSCASTKNMEKTEVDETTTTNVTTDTGNVSVTDTEQTESHSTKQTEDGTEINFGQGGGTYNSKTGEATNVASVKQNSKSTETEDLIREQKTQIDAYKASCDSLAQSVSDYKSELAKEREMPKRTGWNRFCTWWFIITALLLLGYLGYKGYRLYLKFQTGGLL